MSCEEPEPKTISEFVDCIMQTEIIEAREWIDGLKKIVPGWTSYSSQAITEPAVENIAFSISGQISRQLRRLFYDTGQPWQELARKGHEFLREIHQKAVDMGLEVDIDKIDWMLEPEMAKKQIVVG